eukprot:COSAG04_NODE_1812_length_5513_cov_55.382342_5_plen_197_part_00
MCSNHAARRCFASSLLPVGMLVRRLGDVARCRAARHHGALQAQVCTPGVLPGRFLHVLFLFFVSPAEPGLPPLPTACGSSSKSGLPLGLPSLPSGAGVSSFCTTIRRSDAACAALGGSPAASGDAAPDWSLALRRAIRRAGCTEPPRRPEPARQTVAVRGLRSGGQRGGLSRAAAPARPSATTGGALRRPVSTSLR